VTYIDDFAFENCESLSNLKLPDNIAHIGEHAFDGCNNLTSVVIPDSLVEFRAKTFSNCNRLSSITWKGKVYTDKKEFNKIAKNQFWTV
jgi:hypothetical protein